MSSTTNNSSTVAESAERIKLNNFFECLSNKNVAPLWISLQKMVPPKPNPTGVIALWPYASMRPSLIESGTVVSAEEAERRVLMLVNPALTAPYTTDTIYAGLQLILPGETAPAHRHMAFALRFIIEGSQGFTAVEGEKIMMERGDVILTPRWGWHDHGNDGSDPMIWLDGLDLPVFRLLPINFAENYEHNRYPSELVSESKFKITWSTVSRDLDTDKLVQPYARYDYRLPDGSHVSETISAQAERVTAGYTTQKSQETCSFVYHVYEGQGYSTILPPNGQEQKVSWEAKDTFSVPAWSVISHTCTMNSGNAYLFAINDRPMVEALGFARRERY
ncbi:RmlC-like cupin domain-containing protein [Talaromyces proteolyticus]|uniref:RmlC-like cupin domain-containing protein n=1 Tax=Talaromyces proteolyticus TaxID=1131652 RepID=A0AAD4KXM3_9EURO|nr:RmlC-like cupin domain-containing protein [Talaromyces proteolyticus]KAH8703435.1 RmlC-like cupin domain-containing protein [Talaromyces proteolyticus]